MTALYTVTEADYLDNEDGIVKGATVAAVPGDDPDLLYVTSINGEELDDPVAVRSQQLKAA